MLKRRPLLWLVVGAQLDYLLENRVHCVILARKLELMAMVAHRSDNLSQTTTFMWYVTSAELPQNDAKAEDIGASSVLLAS